MKDRSDGQVVAFNVTTSKVIKTGSGRLVNVCTLVVGTNVSFHDCANVVDASAANQLAIETTSSLGSTQLGFSFYTGLVAIITGGGTISVSYN